MHVHDIFENIENEAEEIDSIFMQLIGYLDKIMKFQLVVKEDLLKFEVERHYMIY
jgi:hypothetical protein